eukprot:Anaeramoba_ignava/c17628_g1_i2.p1 GENE.c17628_g1_i2~~c17628_g1_i2.p1  ORF type:complete len:230 (+),score=55.93 c17628_g1_i2:157-846(+)
MKKLDFSLFSLFLLSYNYCRFLLLNWFLVSASYYASGTNTFYRKILNPLFIILGLISFSMAFVAAALSDQENSTSSHMIFYGIELLVLSILTGAIGVKFYRTLSFMSLKPFQKRRMRILFGLIVFFFVLFFVRCIFDLVTYKKRGFFNYLSKSSHRFFIFFFIWSLIFDVIPAFALAIGFHVDLSTVKKSRKGNEPLLEKRSLNKKKWNQQKIAELNYLLLDDEPNLKN